MSLWPRQAASAPTRSLPHSPGLRLCPSHRHVVFLRPEQTACPNDCFLGNRHCNGPYIVPNNQDFLHVRVEKQAQDREVTCPSHRTMNGWVGAQAALLPGLIRCFILLPWEAGSKTSLFHSYLQPCNFLAPCLSQILILHPGARGLVLLASLAPAAATHSPHTLGQHHAACHQDHSAGQESLRSETDGGLVRSSGPCPRLPPGCTLTFLVQWCSHLVKVSPRQRCDSLHWPHPEVNLTLGSSDFPTQCQTQGFSGRRENWPMAAITHWTPLSSFPPTDLTLLRLIPGPPSLPRIISRPSNHPGDSSEDSGRPTLHPGCHSFKVA